MSFAVYRAIRGATRMCATAQCDKRMSMYRLFVLLSRVRCRCCLYIQFNTVKMCLKLNNDSLTNVSNVQMGLDTIDCLP